MYLSATPPTLSLQSVLTCNWAGTSFGPRGSVAVFATSIRIKEDATNRGGIMVVSRTTIDERGNRDLRNLSGVMSDANNFRTGMIAALAPGCPYEVTNVWVQDADQGKEDMVQKLDRMFKKSDQDVFIIYYTGHGSRTGDWVISHESTQGQIRIERISLDELLRMWEHYQCKDAQLIIIADSCHSGAWVKEINAKDPQKIRVSMISSCSDYETCSDSPKGGHFTNYFLDNNQNKQKDFHFIPSRTNDVFCFVPLKISSSPGCEDDEVIHANSKNRENVPLSQQNQDPEVQQIL
jgi:hypothetical protein